jgi:hypothetical protein
MIVSTCIWLSAAAPLERRADIPRSAQGRGSCAADAPPPPGRLDAAAISEPDGAADGDCPGRFVDERPHRAQQGVGLEQGIASIEQKSGARATLIPALSASDLPPFSLSTSSSRGRRGLA